VPFFGPKKVYQVDYAYYWGEHEDMSAENLCYDAAAMERLGQGPGYYFTSLTLHQVSSLSLQYKRMLRDGLKGVLALGPPTPDPGHLVPTREEDWVITLCAVWHERANGPGMPVVSHRLGPAARRRGMNIEEAVVRALTKIWRSFTYEQWCSLLQSEENLLGIISGYEELCQQAGGERLAAQLSSRRAELAEVRQHLADEPTQVEALKAALRSLLEDWDQRGFPHGVGGAQRVR